MLILWLYITQLYLLPRCDRKEIYCSKSTILNALFKQIRLQNVYFQVDKSKKNKLLYSVNGQFSGNLKSFPDKM